MSDETEKRIHDAAEAGRKAREAKEFLDGLTKNDEIIKPIYNPEAWVMRDKLSAAAQSGKLERPACKHPLSGIRQFIDDDPTRRRDGRPVNLFECGVCEMILWFVDPWGGPVGDA